MIKFDDQKLNVEIAKSKKASIFFIGLDCLYSFLLVLFAYASKNVINYAISGNNDLLVLWIIVLSISGLLIPTSKGINNYATNKYSDERVMNVRSILFSRIISKDSIELRNLKNGEVFNRLMSDCRNLICYYTMFIPTIVGEFVQLIGSLVLVVIIRPYIGLLILCLGILAFLGMYLIRVVLKKEEKKVMKSFDDVTSFVSEGVENVETIKLIADRDEISTRLQRKQNQYLNDKKKLRILGVGSSSIFSLAVQILSISLMIYGALKVSDSSLQYGDFAALIELIAIFKSPISALTSIPSNLASFDASSDRLSHMLNLKNEKPEYDFTEDIESIEFENVSFGYTNEMIVKDLTAKISLNEITQIFGESGKGKTTLFKVLMGIYSPSKGKIYLNSVSGKKIDVTKYSIVSLFNYVPQSCLVFSGTVFENLKLSNPNITKEEAIEALKLVNLSSFDLDYFIKENNEGLSRGEAQRLCIARAILTKKPFLILDEATSSLDLKNASKIIKVLSNEFKGIVFCSHKDDDFENVKKLVI